MKKLVLFRHRNILLPTLPGLIIILLILFILIYLLFINAANFLAIEQPVGSRHLIIEGWLGKSELEEARRVFEANAYELAIVSGGPIIDEFNRGPANYAERARAYLISSGFPENKLIAIPASHSAQDRTFLSAVMVRDWYTNQDIRVESLDIFTSSVHSRRSRDLFQLAFGAESRIGVYAATPEGYELDRWWKSSAAIKKIISELLGWMFVQCCFDPGKRGSHSEMWSNSQDW